MYNKVLIAHHNEPVRTHLTALMADLGLDVLTTSSGTQALQYSKNTTDWACFLVAPTLRDLDGLGLISELKKHYWTTPILAISDNHNENVMDTALNLGAHDYISSDIDAQRLSVTLKNAVCLAQKNCASAHASTDQTTEDFDHHAFTPALHKAIMSHIPILIEGAKGTGKSAFANHLGRLTNKEKDIIWLAPYHQSQIDTLSQLKGAYARTLILDDIDQFDMPMQCLLKQCLEEKNFHAVIATTTQCLINQCQLHQFDPALYYRLAIHPARLPELKSQGYRIHTLARKFMHQQAAYYGRGPLHLSQNAHSMLNHHHWPGNLSELKWVMSRACQLEPNATLSLKTLQLAMNQSTQAFFAPDRDSKRDKAIFEPKSIEALERDHIAAMLVHFRGCISEVARELGIGRATLYRKLARYQLGQQDHSTTHTAQDGRCIAKNEAA